MEFVELSAAEFTKFEQKSPYGNFFQGAKRAELRKNMGWHTYLLGFKEEGKVVGACHLMEMGGEALVQIGPILDWNDKKLAKKFIAELKEFCVRKGFINLEVFPPVLLSIRDAKGEKTKKFDQKAILKIFEDAGFAYWGETIPLENKANRWMAIKKLDGLKTMAEVQASYKKNVRNKLRKVSPELEVYELKEKSEIPLLARVVDESNVKNKVTSRHLEYYKWIWDIYGDQVRWIAARKKDTKEFVAGRILFYHPNEVVSFISGTAQQYKKLNGMTFLQDWLLEDCLQRGIQRVNFYGISGNFDDSNKLLEFKSGFGVEIEEYIGGFQLVLDAKRYKMRKAKSKVVGFLRDVKHGGETVVKKIKRH